MTERERRRVVILGGGFAGLQAAFALRGHAGDRAQITLVSRRGEFVMTPATLHVPFGAQVASCRLEIGPAAARRGIDFVRATATGVDPDRGRVPTEEGRDLAYDRLLIATGAVPDPGHIPGLGEHARSIWDVDDLVRLRRDLARIVEAAARGRRLSILFALPAGNACPKPLYEMVLALDAWLRRQRVRGAVELSFSTYERTYLRALGDLDPQVSAEFHRLGIHGNRLYALASVIAGRAFYRNGAAIDYDLLVTFPPQRPAVDYSNLARSREGWLERDPETGEAPGHPEILVAGDAATGEPRTAFRALAEADVAAFGLARWLRGPGYRIPRPVSVRDATWAPESRAWRAGRQLVEAYLPRRFRRGLPFESELGVRALAKIVG